MTVEDNTQKTTFDADNVVLATSISLDSRYIALARCSRDLTRFLEVYCTSTGQVLRFVEDVSALWFVPSGHEIWCTTGTEASVFTVT